MNDMVRRQRQQNNPPEREHVARLVPIREEAEVIH